MSFSFSFSGNDIEEDDHDATPNDPSESITTSLKNTTINPTSQPPTTIAPKRHTLSDLLQSLPDQLSYNYIDVPLSPHNTHEDTRSNTDEDALSNTDTGPISLRIPRRSLFDIRQQLMHESDPVDESSEVTRTSSLLSGLETGDLSTGIYEGGFKTWECAVDLASFVSWKVDSGSSFLSSGAFTFEEEEEGMQGGGWRVVELGAGSAVPCLVLLRRVLEERRRMGGASRGTVRFTLCDYNEDVLRLCTAVNVFLTVVLTVGLEDGLSEEEEEDDLEVDEDLVGECLETLQDANIEVDFVSGAWGNEFLELLKEPGERAGESDMEKIGEEVLVLASETIYEPRSLDVFSKTVVDILSLSLDKGKAEAYVAAKKVYFGVGGGVAEFEEEIRKVGGKTKTVLDVKGAGVGRVVLEVMAG